MLDAARMTDGTRVRRRAFAGALALGIVIAFAVAVPLNIYLPYHLGAVGHMDYWMTQGSPQQHFRRLRAVFRIAEPAAHRLVLADADVFRRRRRDDGLPDLDADGVLLVAAASAGLCAVRGRGARLSSGFPACWPGCSNR